MRTDPGRRSCPSRTGTDASVEVDAHVLPRNRETEAVTATSTFTASVKGLGSAPLGQKHPAGDSGDARDVALLLEYPETVVRDRGAADPAAPGDLPDGGRVRIVGDEDTEEFQYPHLSPGQRFTGSGSARSVSEGGPADTAAGAPAGFGMGQIPFDQVDCDPPAVFCLGSWPGMSKGFGGPVRRLPRPVSVDACLPDRRRRSFYLFL